MKDLLQIDMYIISKSYVYEPLEYSFLSLSLSLSLTHTHTHSLTLTQSHTLTDTHSHTNTHERTQISKEIKHFLRHGEVGMFVIYVFCTLMCVITTSTPTVVNEYLYANFLNCCYFRTTAAFKTLGQRPRDDGTTLDRQTPPRPLR